MKKDFYLRYDIVTQKLWHNGSAVRRFDHITCSGERLTFEQTAFGLVWHVPFFLVDNIFYFRKDNSIFFGRHLDLFRTQTEPDQTANEMLKKHGFLPHARTQLTGVSIICSYLTYRLDSKGIKITQCFPNFDTSDNYSVDDLMEVFRSAFLKQIERVNRTSWVLPLSGGMDSRLLLSLALEHKDIDLKLFTVGTHRCGDVKVAKSIANSLGLSGKHYILQLEDVTRFDVLKNYSACDYLLPLDRILIKPLGCFFEPSAVLSGLYGDVIFADNIQETKSYSDYYQSEGFKVFDSQDQQIVEAYDDLPNLTKLQRIVLRCQKLTRQSFPISPDFDFIIPFVDPQVVIAASNICSPRIYQNIVSRHMNPKLRPFIHQSTLSYFTHPNWLRKAERKTFKLLRHPLRLPYFDNEYLKSVGISLNETPQLD
jgi:hypothetical protein